jgi:hypothetical protein
MVEVILSGDREIKFGFIEVKIFIGGNNMAVKEWLAVKKIQGIDGKIKQVENTFGIQFPNDFRQCIIENNAGYPKPDCFYIGFKGEVFNNLLTFDLESQYSILNIFNILKNRLIDKVFPFGRDPFGNYICFDYRNGDKPIIVFWEHETASIDKASAIKKVCDSFSELIDMLEENEEEEEH